MISDLYTAAIVAGISQDAFWDLSAWEITRTIIAKNEYDKAHIKQFERSMCAFAYNIGQLVSIGFHAPKKYPDTFEKAFPKLFDIDSEGIPVSDWERSRQSMAEYARATRGRYVK